MPPKRRKPVTDNSPTPLDEKARALAAEAEQVRAEMEKHQRLIEKAPEIAREQAKRRREELINRASRTDARPGSRVALHDPRYGYELNAAMTARPRSLRSERQRGRLLFFVLLMLLVAVAFWGYHTFTQQ